MAINAMNHHFRQQKCVVHLCHLHKLARSHCRGDMLDMEDGWNALVPLI
jgi:hypothetical protein